MMFAREITAVKQLLQHGLDVRVKAKDDKVAVAEAVSRYRETVVWPPIDLASVPDLNAADGDRRTALMRAASRGDLGAVRRLAGDRKENVNATDKNGWTALLWATSNPQEHLEVVRYLVGEAGADVDAASREGWTALMLAARNGHFELVRYLAGDCVANVNARRNDGETALMMATADECIDVVRYLAQDRGAKVSFKTMDGKTAIRIAMDRGNQDIQRVLTPFLPTPRRATRQTQSAAVQSSTRSSRWSIPPSEIALIEFVDAGNVGGEYRAKWLDADAAVKLFIAEASHLSFEDELGMWQQLRHPNVAQIYGACDTGPHLKFFVCEFASNGSLLEYVKATSVEHRTTWKFLHQAAVGLEYLHERGIVHGDLRCSNILIGSDGLAKLSNFGLSGLMSLRSPTPGPTRWQPPEVLAGNPSSAASDVYSLGMCVLEAATKTVPWGNLIAEWVRSYKAAWMPESDASSSVEPPCATGEARDLAWRMCCHDPEKRMKLPQAVHELERLAINECCDSEDHQPEREPALIDDGLDLGHGHARPVLPEGFARPRDARWQQQRCERFASGVADVYLLLSELGSTEEKVAFVQQLQAEIETSRSNYTADQVQVMRRASEAISSTLDAGSLMKTAPTWFIPWREFADEWQCLGVGGYGSVYLTKWLDSEVAVKEVTLAGSGGATATASGPSFVSRSVKKNSRLATPADPVKRAAALAMFRREVDIWYDLSHPHVIWLFGACHVGWPLFVCEYATNKTLVSYLKAHPDQLWAKLYEAALGVQYLHSRGVVHGDLKGNNIVIGSDLKAKVTDFGLSLLAGDGAAAIISAASHWVAPECFTGASPKPTCASDVYSLGMCIVEALRAVGGEDCCFPWRHLDNLAVRGNARLARLPSRPNVCNDSEWELVKRMCAFEPEKRIKISTVVDELAKLKTDDLVAAQDTASMEMESVPATISTARGLLSHRLNRRSEIPLYQTLWDRLERIHGLIDGELDGDKCQEAFCSLVTAAEASTKMVQTTNSSLMVFAESTMRGYALHRRLDKFVDAFWVGESTEGTSAAELTGVATALAPTASRL